MREKSIANYYIPMVQIIFSDNPSTSILQLHVSTKWALISVWDGKHTAQWISSRDMLTEKRSPMMSHSKTFSDHPPSYLITIKINNVRFVGNTSIPAAIWLLHSAWKHVSWWQNKHQNPRSPKTTITNKTFLSHWAEESNNSQLTCNKK